MKANQDRSIEEEAAINQAALQAFVDNVRPLFEDQAEKQLELPDPARLAALTSQFREKQEQACDRGEALNPWSVAGLKRHEVRNCAVLASLLDSDQFGVTARAFLGALLACAAERSDRAFPLKDIEAGNYVVRCETCLAGDWSNRVDLLIESTGIEKGWMIAIEAKIGAGLGKNQLENYHRDMDRRARSTGREAFLFFLAPFEPNNIEPTTRDALVHLRWSDVAAAARVASAGSDGISCPASFLLDSFREHVAGFDAATS